MFGWGKKKTKVIEGDGYLGELSERQADCLAQVKAWMNEMKFDENPWFSDTFILKFCRARKFDIGKVIEMFEKYMTYRKENGIDTIL